jgi:hypothetical protein
MKRRFVIGIDALSESQEAEFRKYISSQGAWWHWIKNLWLLTTNDDDVSADKVRDEILRLNPTARTIVMEFPEDITWAASGSKNAQGKKLADWLRAAWDQE